MEILTPEIIAHAYSYAEYRALATQLLEQGKTTASLSLNPGVTEDAKLLEYTRLNEQRMNRLEKTFLLDPQAAEDLAQIKEPMLWLVITESWCGDAAQIVPVLHHLSRHNPHISLRFVLRDQYLALMDAFLTHGGRSIPKILFVEPDSGKILNSWGPRPAAVQELMLEFKAAMLAALDETLYQAKYEEAKTAVHSWYAHDKTVHTQREFVRAAASSYQGR